jgi:DNA-directed RNA polymerase beta' subunit
MVPNPVSLHWSHCALPLEALIALYKEPLTKWATEKGERQTAEMVQKLPEWPAEINKRYAADIEDLLKRFLRDTHKLLLVNRQPTLHRYSIKALFPQPIEGCKQDLQDMLNNRAHARVSVVQVSPLVCKSMGADFDGDTMAVHKLAQPREDWQAQDLLPTQRANLLSAASGLPVPDFEQDFVLGHYLISMGDARLRSRLEQLLPTGCEQCRQLLPSGEWIKDSGTKFLTHLCKDHVDAIDTVLPAWMRLAFDVVTQAGISFGVFDLLDCHPTDKLPRQVSKNDPEATNKKISGMVHKKLHDIAIRSTPSMPSPPGFACAAMAISKARGSDQIRQLVGARGYLDPGETNLDMNPNDHFFRTSLLDGMDRAQAFQAAMNGRASMVAKKLGPAEAGALFRKLVMALWPWRIQKGDCGYSGSQKRSPAVCTLGSQATVCQVCYGELPWGGQAPENYRAGLIAAQSIAEPGTQVSMQAFHTGRKAFSVKDLVEAFRIRRRI